MSRFRFFVLLVALAALATAFAACGSSDKSSEDPQEVINTATLEGVKSGNLDLSLAISSQGKEGGDLDVTLSGPFQGGAKKSLPQLDLTVAAKGVVEDEDVDFEGGLTLLSDRAYVNYKGTEYEVDPTTFSFVKSALEDAEGEAGSEAADVTACQEAAAGLKVRDFVDNLTNEGGADVDGTETTKISGDLDVPAAIDALIDLTKDPACKAQLESAGPLSLDELEEAKSELTSAVKKAHVDVYVGDDDIVRKLVAELTVEPEDSKSEKVEVDLDLTLSGVNEEQEISAPAGAKPLEGLFKELGVNPLDLLEASQNGEGLGSLLESITDQGLPFGGDSSSGGSGGSGGGGGQQAYLECLKGARTPTDLQRCASMVQ